MSAVTSEPPIDTSPPHPRTGRQIANAPLCDLKRSRPPTSRPRLLRFKTAFLSRRTSPHAAVLALVLLVRLLAASHSLQLVRSAGGAGSGLFEHDSDQALRWRRHCVNNRPRPASISTSTPSSGTTEPVSFSCQRSNVPSACRRCQMYVVLIGKALSMEGWLPEDPRPATPR
jgi:hypothetical protein